MIEAFNLEKNFSGITAVNKVSLKINEGDIVGFLGPNGAGKSTTMRLLSGFLSLDGGSAKICGYDVAKDRLKAQSCIGYLPEAANGFPHLTAKEFLTYCIECRGSSNQKVSNAINHVVDLVGLKTALNKKMLSLSKGWRQRIWLAQALIHDPPVLILDEPTDGLDPNQKDHIRHLIKSIAKNKTIILSTHILEEAEQICNRGIVLVQGKVVSDKLITDLTDDQGRISSVFRKLTDIKNSYLAE